VQDATIPKAASKEEKEQITYMQQCFLWALLYYFGLLIVNLNGKIWESSLFPLVKCISKCSLRKNFRTVL